MYHFRIKESSTKFHIKVRKPHFGKNKSVLENDVEKYDGIFLKKKLLVKYYPFNINEDCLYFTYYEKYI